MSEDLPGLTTASLRVIISRFVSPCQPGIVECVFTDAGGVERRFLEKVPIVTAEWLDGSSDYPQAGEMECVVVGSRVEGGREVATIEIDGMMMTLDMFREDVRFDVFAKDLIEARSPKPSIVDRTKSP